MTPKLSASLHALTQAARKGMVPHELEMHLEQITNEIEEMQKRAGLQDALATLATMPIPDAGVKDLSGRKETAQVEIKGPITPILDMVVKSFLKDSAWAMKIYATCFFGGHKDVAAIVGEYGQTAARCADQMNALIESKKKK